MFLIRITFIVLLILLSGSLYAQNCFEYHKTNCNTVDSRFNYQENRSSVSFKFASGESRTIPFEMYSGKDYKIQICADAVFDDVIQIRIVSEEGKVIYDNSQNNYSLNIEFSSKRSQSSEIELSAPQPAAGVSDTIYQEGCIGILIKEMISIKTGF